METTSSENTNEMKSNNDCNGSDIILLLSKLNDKLDKMEKDIIYIKNNINIIFPQPTTYYNPPTTFSSPPPPTFQSPRSPSPSSDEEIGNYYPLPQQQYYHHNKRKLSSPQHIEQQQLGPDFKKLL